MYKKVRVMIIKESSEFPNGKVAWQGDPISPQLFTATLDETFLKLDWNNVYIGREYLNHLKFAEDIVLIASSFEKLQQINELNFATNEEKSVRLMRTTSLNIRMRGYEAKHCTNNQMRS